MFLITLILMITIAFVAYTHNRRGTKEPDYRTIFIIGIAYLPIGIATEDPLFFILGSVFMVMGMANKEKWNP